MPYLVSGVDLGSGGRGEWLNSTVFRWLSALCCALISGVGKVLVVTVADQGAVQVFYNHL